LSEAFAGDYSEEDEETGKKLSLKAFQNVGKKKKGGE